MEKNCISECYLENGFKLIVKEDHRSSIAIFQISYRVGSGHEYNGITGISHILEHMMFRGTRQISSKQYLKQISLNGSHHNAHTGRDYTTYYHLVNMNALERSVALEADRMCGLLLQEEGFKKEKKIVLEERSLQVDDNPQHLAYEHFLSVAYMTSAYRHLPIGWINDIKNISLSDVRNWYKSWYVPNNAIGIVIGDVKPKNMYQLFEKYFSSLPSSTLPDLKEKTDIELLGRRYLEINIHTTLPWIIMGYHAPVLNTAKIKWEPYALYILCEILAGSNSARLQKNLVRGMEILVKANYQYSPFSRMDNLLIVEATPTSYHSIEEAKNRILCEIERLKTELIVTDELERIKTKLTADRIYQSDSIAYQAEEACSFESVGLSWREIDKAYKIFSAIEPEQIRSVANKYLIESHLTLAVLKPQDFSNKLLTPFNHGDV